MSTNTYKLQNFVKFQNKAALLGPTWAGVCLCEGVKNLDFSKRPALDSKLQII